jgi:hypothetical protein
MICTHGSETYHWPAFFFVLLVFDTVSWQKVNKRYAFHPFLFDEPKTLNPIFFMLHQYLLNCNQRSFRLNMTLKIRFKYTLKIYYQWQINVGVNLFPDDCDHCKYQAHETGFPK